MMASFNPGLPHPVHTIMPPVSLFHGTADKTYADCNRQHTRGFGVYSQIFLSSLVHRSVPYRTTSAFASALKRAGIHAHVKFYEGKSHTGNAIAAFVA
jgi:hypothetical protein